MADGGGGGVLVKTKSKGENRKETRGREKKIPRQEKVQMGRR